MSYTDHFGFGLAFVRTPGGPVHPDDVLIIGELEGEEYDKQLKRYKEWHGEGKQIEMDLK